MFEVSCGRVGDDSVLQQFYFVLAPALLFIAIVFEAAFAQLLKNLIRFLLSYDQRMRFEALQNITVGLFTQSVI